MNPHVALEKLEVRYRERAAVDGVSLSIRKGELVSLLGPSGCGKTTTLRAIAGFVAPSSGSIRISDLDVTSVPAHKRNVGVVFQSYALFPHLTASENVAFGLRMRHVAKEQRLRRARDALAMVGLADYGQRYPAQMSGGQQQRVALARALVIEPSILLLDEPLSNLDAHLRAEMRGEIQRLQKRLAITTIFVTHDQAEALAISDRVAVMHQGKLVAIDTPQALCDRPGDAIAAAFLGGRTIIAGLSRNGIFEAPGLKCSGAPDGAAHIVLRAARLDLGGAPTALELMGRVTTRTYLGDAWEADLDTPAGRVRVLIDSALAPPEPGQICTINARPGGVEFTA